VELHRDGIFAESRIESAEPVGDVRTPAQLTFEREEADLFGGVELAQLCGKLEAVDDLRRTDEENMLRTQIAVCVAHPSGGYSISYQRVVSFDEAELILGDRAHGVVLGFEAGQHELIGGIHALASLGSREIVRTPWCAYGSAIERAQRIHENGESGIVCVERRQERFERVLAGEATHLHEPVDRMSVAFEAQAGTVQAQRHDSDVRIRRKAAVEGNFELAVCAARRGCCQVELKKANWFLELVNIPSGNEHPGEMGLHDLDDVRSVWKRRRLAQVRQLFRRVGGFDSIHHADRRNGAVSAIYV